MIRKIHYCWFGSAKPPAVEANIAKWKNLNPEFDFYEWNEQNIDVSAYEFGRRALEQKRWGFLVDIIRPQKLASDGGFYIDADVELLRPLHILEPEGSNLIMGYTFDCALGTAVIYSPARHPVIQAVLNEYQSISPNSWPVSNSVFTDYFINNVPGFLLNGRRWKSEAAQISLYPKEFFEQPAFIRTQGIAVHHSSGSWILGNSGKDFVTGRAVYSHKLKWLKRKIRVFHNLLRSEYREAYFKALFGTRVHKTSDWKMGSEKV